MPVGSVSAPTITGTSSGTATVRYTGNTNATLQLIAVNSSGQQIVVGTETVVSGRGNNFTPITFAPNTISTLPPGNYTFFVQVNQSNGGNINGASSGSSFICFLEGTLIRTPTGEAQVESLRPGDLVLTADGRREAVLFVGRQTIAPYFGMPEARNPILIRAGALAEGVPARDLKVSPHHGMVVDGVLCFAQALVNGTSIVQVPSPAEAFTYYAIELAAHEVILAEGAPAESFCDNVPRERFDNHAEFAALFPEGREVGEMDLPHAKSRRQVPASILARLDARGRDIAGLPAKAAA